MIKFLFFICEVLKQPIIFLASIFKNYSPKPMFYCPFLKNISLLFFGAIRSQKELNHILTNSFQNFNKISSKIDQAHCSFSIRIMRSPLSRRFQHSLHNKPAKVENNLKSFQTVFILKANIFVYKNFSMTLSPLTHLMFAHDLLIANLIQNFNRGIEPSRYQFKKTRPESIVKQTTLMPLNYSRTNEV